MNDTQKPAWAIGTYRVTIKHERDEWVARDAKGDWRTRGKFKECETALEVAQWLYHADEVASAEYRGGDVVATIYTSCKWDAQECNG